jgi:hypothetical protein
VKVFIECLPSSGGGEQWTGTKIPPSHGSFKYDHKATFSKLPRGKVSGTVDVTGTFKGGKFVGTWQPAGTSCGKTNYKATAGAGGSGY